MIRIVKRLNVILQQDVKVVLFMKTLNRELIFTIIFEKRLIIM